MGDKATARETMRKAGVPTVPGSAGLIEVRILEHLSVEQQTRSGWAMKAFSYLLQFPTYFGCFATYMFATVILQTTEEAVRVANEIGFPVMIKVPFIALSFKRKVFNF